jgi:hypothetical protein
VLFFDEIPWIATKRSNFLELIGHFWNDWAVRNNVLPFEHKTVFVFVCIGVVVDVDVDVDFDV